MNAASGSQMTKSASNPGAIAPLRAPSPARAAGRAESQRARSAGVAPRARVMAVKGFPATGPGLDSALAQGIVYAAANGADVINNSWSCGLRCPTNFLIDEAVRIANFLGTVVVTSAGNSADDVLFQSPKFRRDTIAVAASREDDSIAPFSSGGYLVDVTARVARLPDQDGARRYAIEEQRKNGGAGIELTLDPGGVIRAAHIRMKMGEVTLTAESR